jgi:hypothetical protein
MRDNWRLPPRLASNNQIYDIKIFVEPELVGKGRGKRDSLSNIARVAIGPPCQLIAISKSKPEERRLARPVVQSQHRRSRRQSAVTHFAVDRHFASGAPWPVFGESILQSPLFYTKHVGARKNDVRQL